MRASKPSMRVEDLPGNRDEAIASGASYYFTGQPCRKGHIAPRYTRSGACNECLHPTLTKPRVTTDVRFIARSIPFSIDRRLALSEKYLPQLDQYLQGCIGHFVQHLETTDHSFPMWCSGCQGKGKTIDPRRIPVVLKCETCNGSGVQAMPDLSNFKVTP
jgi:hypothetical protein